MRVAGKLRVLFYGSGLMARKLGYLASKAGIEVVFYDKDPSKAREASEIVGGGHVASPSTVVRGSVVIVAVPGAFAVEALRHVTSLANIEPPLAVSDISTFKADLIGYYKSVPQGVLACPIHPLFGPRAERLDAHWTAVVPVPGREEDCKHFTAILDRLGLKYFFVDPETHDRLVGLTIGVSYALGLALAYRNLKVGVDQSTFERHMGTTFRLLQILSETVSSDPSHLITEILGNEYTKRAIGELAELLRGLASDPRPFIEASKSRRRSCRDPYGVLYEVIEDVARRRC
ncbi:MAG: prephenate dehydrogenase/arogenate dehydrogenase family protein [Desulfurococcales archaeon]|nr:prephenate dehydrogenase/arogenate dehydrogenase family protein [Desulfurococcales archaeon]